MAPLRARLAALAHALLVLACLASSAAIAARVRRPAHAFGRDATTVELARLDRLRPLLPPGGAVGFETDAEDVLHDRSALRRFYLAQYALAPVVVVAGRGEEIVVGDYADPAGRCRICAAPGFRRVADLGDGLMLFRRTGP